MESMLQAFADDSRSDRRLRRSVRVSIQRNYGVNFRGNLWDKREANGNLGAASIIVISR